MYQDEHETAKSLLIETVLHSPSTTLDGLIQLSNLQVAASLQESEKEYFTNLQEEINQELTRRDHKDEKITHE